jgi:glycosyltransferase involved in cell wall biosynthesis
MRILHVTDTFLPTLGGVEILVHDLSTRQAAAGHEVSVLTRTRASTDAMVPGVRVVHGHAPNPALLAEVDVVHAHVSTMSVLAARTAEAAAKTGVPALVTVHSMWSGAGAFFRATALARDWDTLPIQWAAVSEAAAGPLGKALGPSQPILILPNAIETSAWTPQPRVEPREAVTLVSAMRLVRRKRPFALLGMLRLVRRLVPDEIPLRAVIVGDGTWRAAMQLRLDATGMRHWVELPGSLERPAIHDLYRSADIYLAPANLESFGIAVLEARTAGLAVVAKRSTGVADIITDGIEGHLVDSDRAMAEQIARLCRDDAARETILRHNRATLPGYDWSAVLPLIDKGYAAAAARSGRHRSSRTRTSVDVSLGGR